MIETRYPTIRSVRNFYMMKKGNIIVSFLILILVIWAGTSTFLLIQKKDKIVIIKVTEQGTALVNELSKEDELVSEKAFFRRYVGLMYNYDFLSFEDNVKKVSFMLSQEFWNKASKEMQGSKKRIYQDRISQSTALTKIIKRSETEYELLTQSTVIKGPSSAQDRSFRIKVIVARVTRSSENPWGMEIASASEDRL